MLLLKGRSIVENNLIAHEMVRDFNKRGANKVCIKLDIRKAYDMLNMDFVCHVMLSLGFDPKWVDRVQVCISSAIFSLLIKGHPHGFFRSNRGLRRGYPLSPYLFTLVMKFFTCMMDMAMHRKLIKTLYSRVQPNISHLIHADGLLVFIEPSIGGMEVVAAIMTEFGVQS